MKHKVKLVSVFVLITTAVSGYLLWDLRLSPKARGLEVLRSHLYDPESARLENVAYNPKTGSTCGYVNAKNRMGGYVGFVEFVVTEKGALTIAPKPRSTNDSASDQIAALEKRLQFLDVVEAQCPGEEVTADAADTPAADSG